ncbi:MAG: hypothetical protein R3A49_13130 [Acidimicrobiia bacterium]
MEVTTFLIADHAEAVKGKLYVTGGGWDVLTFSKLPARRAHVSLAVVLRVPWHETDMKHALSIDLVDADNHSLLSKGPVGGSFSAGRPPHARVGDDQPGLFVMNFDNVGFKEPGDYRFLLSVNDEPLADARFKVVLKEPSDG